VVTDSACSLPAELARQAGIVIVPLWLTIGGRQYRDGELSLEEVVRRLPEGVTTAGPSPGELAQGVEQADQGDGVVVLTVSQRMSAVYQAARLATRLLDGKDVRVVDTRTAAGGQGLVVLAASGAAQAGASLGQVVAEAERAASGARLVATLPSLEHLARGGRVPGAAAWGARWLGLNPMFEFVDGKARPLRPARGQEQACARAVSMLARSAPKAAGRPRELNVAALHALAPDVAERLLGQVGELGQLGQLGQGADGGAGGTSFAAPFSSVMVAHTGPGLVGLAWWWS
jgi:DegV family protein with EDD domain